MFRELIIYAISICFSTFYIKVLKHARPVVKASDCPKFVNFGLELSSVCSWISIVSSSIAIVLTFCLAVF